MEQRVDWLSVALRVAALGVGLGSAGVAILLSPASQLHAVGRGLLGAGGTLLACGMLCSLWMALRPLALGLYYKKPRLPPGWNLEAERRQIEKGVYRLRLKLVRTAMEQLPPCSLRFRFNRPVLKADLHRPTKLSDGRYLYSTAAHVIGHDGMVTVTIGEVTAGDEFYVEGHLDSDGPLKLQRVDYQRSEPV